MFYKRTLAIYLVFIFGTVSVTNAEDVTDEGQVTVTLSVPYPELLQDELRPNSTITLTNNSPDTLYCAPDGFAGCIPEGYPTYVFQVFLKADLESSILEERRKEDFHPDIETYGQWESVRKFASLELKPGQSMVWKAAKIPYSFFSISSSWGESKSIQAQVLIGPDKWVSSNVVPIKFVKQRLKDFPVVFKGDLLIGPQRAKSPIWVHQVKINNKEYLFSSGRSRICEIPKGGEPDFEWEPRLGLLKIDFKLDHVPVFWYNFSMINHLDSDMSITDFYRQEYNFKYGDNDHRQRALKGMASHGTAASVQLFDTYKGSDELLLQHRNRYECLRLLLNRAGKVDDTKQARQRIRQALFADTLHLGGESIPLPPLEFSENEAQKAASFLDEFVKNIDRSVLAEEDREKTKALILKIKKQREN